LTCRAPKSKRVKEQLNSVIGMDPEEPILISAKSGLGVDEVLEAIVKRIPHPKGSVDAPLKALLFDSGSMSIAASS
jgi:GTP-binding protein LepA